MLDLLDKCAKGIPFDDTFEFKDAEGTLKWVRSIGLPVYAKSGEITHLEGTFQDVSEQVKREEELRESKTYFSLAMQGANLGVWDWYLKDNSVEFDARWCQMLGLDVKEIPMELSTWESRVHPDDLESCYSDIKAYLDGKTEYYENVHRMKHAEGHWVYILDRGRISDWDADGNPTRFTGTHMDITEVESLKRERDHIFSEFKIGTFKWDIVNNHVEWDANNFKVFGVDEKDFGNAYEAWASCLHPDWTERAQQDVQDALQGSGGFDTVFRVKTSNDSPKYIRGVAKIERNGKGEPLFMTGLNMDITAQYIAEKELERKKEVDIHQAKLASIGELAAGVGHEINNPLSIINGYLKMLERRIVEAAAKDEKVSELTHKIGQASERIKNIVKGLRNFSRAIDNETSEFSLKEVIEESVDMLREIYLSEGVHVSLDLSGSKDDFCVLAVRGQLQQIILNLIANAKDASEGRENRKVEISLFTEGDQHVLKVSDNGKGIPSAIAKKIFEPFFTTKEVNRGTGIGLSMAQRLAGHNSGSIDFQSVEGEGTDFYLRLPQHIKNTLAPDLSPDSGPNSSNEERKYRVLLLDDEEDIREIVGFQLENMGFEVYGFATGAEALESIESGGLQYDFVISDVKMPVMSGGQFLDELRTKHRNSYKYFVFITGGTNIDFEDPSNEFKDKIDGYIYKPFSDEALGHLLLNLADSEEQVPAAALAKAS